MSKPQKRREKINRYLNACVIENNLELSSTTPSTTETTKSEIDRRFGKFWIDFGKLKNQYLLTFQQKPA